MWLFQDRPCHLSEFYPKKATSLYGGINNAIAFESVDETFQEVLLHGTLHFSFFFSNVRISERIHQEIEQF